VTASSEHDAHHSAAHGALNSRPVAGANAWCSRVIDRNQWIEVKLDTPRAVVGFAIQGRGDCNQYVTACKIMYAGTDRQFRMLPQEFAGPADHTLGRRHDFATAVYAHYVRLCPTQWRRHCSLRWEVYVNPGIPPQPAVQSEAVGLEVGYPSLEMAASSSCDHNHTPEHGGLNYSGPVAQAWCARSNDANQWIEVKLPAPRWIVGFAIQGRGDIDQRVTSCQIAYAGTDMVYRTIPRAFEGAVDRNTIIRHDFAVPVFAKYVRLCPKQWEAHISLRWEVFAARVEEANCIDSTVAANCIDSTVAANCIDSTVAGPPAYQP